MLELSRKTYREVMTKEVQPPCQFPVFGGEATCTADFAGFLRRCGTRYKGVTTSGAAVMMNITLLQPGQTGEDAAAAIFADPFGSNPPKNAKSLQYAVQHRPRCLTQPEKVEELKTSHWISNRYDQVFVVDP
jgi:hypothetical protein